MDGCRGNVDEGKIWEGNECLVHGRSLDQTHKPAAPALWRLHRRITIFEASLHAPFSSPPSIKDKVKVKRSLLGRVLSYPLSPLSSVDRLDFLPAHTGTFKCPGC